MCCSRSDPGSLAGADVQAGASALASAAKKRVRTAELSQDLSSLPPADSHTAVYDIAARTVYMPNGRRLEAHSGLGNLMDDPSHINAKGPGADAAKRI